VRLIASSHRFRFADTIVSSSGFLQVDLPTPGQLISFPVDAVDADIPLLLGLDFLDRHGLDILTTANRLVCTAQGWSLPLIRHRNYVFLTWSARAFFTRAQLTKMHGQCCHPSTAKVLALIRRADPSAWSVELSTMLDDIRVSFRTCQAGVCT
jgi:hypothetical protein